MTSIIPHTCCTEHSSVLPVILCCSLQSPYACCMCIVSGVGRFHFPTAMHYCNHWSPPCQVCTVMLSIVAAVPVVDTTPEEPPPFVVVVHGPPGVGKTTLIKNLIKHYVNQNLSEVKGPITVVSGKTRRLTFVECPQVLGSSLCSRRRIACCVS